MDNRFRKANRIRTKSDFQRAFSKKPIRSTFCSIYVQPNSTSESRLGLIVSRKIGNAVQRNRVKRLLREVFRRIKNHLTSPTDLVIRAHPAILSLSYEALYDEIVRLLSPSIMPYNNRSQDREFW